MKTQFGNRRPCHAFSLVEVVLALGVIAIVITTILGLVPVALRTGHSAQDETRGAEIAQTIFGSLVAQAPSQFSNIQLPLPGNTTLSPAIDLNASSPPTTMLYAGNDGQLMQLQSADAAYAITIFTNNSPPGFTDVGYANEVTVRVAWPANAPTAANQTIRDFVRIISKY